MLEGAVRAYVGTFTVLHRLTISTLLRSRLTLNALVVLGATRGADSTRQALAVALESSIRAYVGALAILHRSPISTTNTPTFTTREGSTSWAVLAVVWQTFAALPAGAFRAGLLDTSRTFPILASAATGRAVNANRDTLAIGTLLAAVRAYNLPSGHTCAILALGATSRTRYTRDALAVGTLGAAGRTCHSRDALAAETLGGTSRAYDLCSRHTLAILALGAASRTGQCCSSRGRYTFAVETLGGTSRAWLTQGLLLLSHTFAVLHNSADSTCCSRGKRLVDEWLLDWDLLLLLLLRLGG